MRPRRVELLLELSDATENVHRRRADRDQAERKLQAAIRHRNRVQKELHDESVGVEHLVPSLSSTVQARQEEPLLQEG